MDTLAAKVSTDEDDGELLDLADRDGCDVFFTTDQNLRYRQDLTGRAVRIVVLLATAEPVFASVVPRLASPSHQSDRWKSGESPFESPEMVTDYSERSRGPRQPRCIRGNRACDPGCGLDS